MGVKLPPLSAGSLSGSALPDLVRSTVSAGTLIAGTFALVYAYRKQRIDEAASFRADGEHLSKRYQDGAVQLGHERAAVRLAGVYSISRLADDWPDNRQMCIDLLCAYLRMPYVSMVDNDDEYVVRASLFEVIRQHVQDPDAETSWSRYDFDFSGGTFDGLDLSGGKFYGIVTFQDSRFTGFQRREDGKNFGWFRLRNCVFKTGISFFQARFDQCVVSFDGSKFEAGEVFFGGAEFTDFNLFFRDSSFLGGRIYFGGGKFECSEKAGSRSLGHVWFNGAEFGGSELEFRGFRAIGAIEIEFDSVRMIAGRVDMAGLHLKSGYGTEPKLLVAPSEAVDGVLRMPPDSGRQLEFDLPLR